MGLRQASKMKPYWPNKIMRKFQVSFRSGLCKNDVGYMIGLTNSPLLDELIKYTRPPWQDTDEHKITINKSIQYLG